MPAMSEDNSFVLNIRANPDDEMARLIYADYLEERGDPRGELIRLQCEISHLAPDDALAPELTAREDELLAAHGEEWLAPLRELGAIGVSPRCFRRGLIERIVISAADFAARAEAICRTEPALHIVQLKRLGDGMDALEKVKLPEQVRCVDLSANGLTALPRALAKWSAQIEELNLAFNSVSERFSSLTAVTWPMLRRLSLARNGMGPGNAKTLVSASMPTLASLSLQLNPLEDEGMRELMFWPQLSRLTELDLATTGIGSQGLARLTYVGVLKELRRLNLRGNRIPGPAMLELIRRSEWSLDYLDLRNNLLASDGGQRIGSPAGKESASEIVRALRERFGDAVIV